MTRKRRLFRRRRRPSAQQTCLKTGPGGEFSATLVTTSDKFWHFTIIFTDRNEDVDPQTRASHQHRAHHAAPSADLIQEIINTYFGRQLDQCVDQLSQIHVEAKACNVEADAIKGRRHAKPAGRNLAVELSSRCIYLNPSESLIREIQTTVYQCGKPDSSYLEF